MLKHEAAQIIALAGRKVVMHMRNVNTWLMIFLVGILMAMPLESSAADSSTLEYNGVQYKVISDDQFWQWYCKKNPEDERCIARISKRLLATIPVAQLDNTTEVDNVGNTQENVDNSDNDIVANPPVFAPGPPIDDGNNGCI